MLHNKQQIWHAGRPRRKKPKLQPKKPQKEAVVVAVRNATAAAATRVKVASNSSAQESRTLQRFVLA